jgi:hypothetical protein
MPKRNYSELEKTMSKLSRLTLRDDNVVAGAGEWARAVHEYAKEKGWWEGGVGKRNLPEIFLLIKSEIIEAHEEWRKKGATLTRIYESDVGLPEIKYKTNELPEIKYAKKPEGVPIELADCAIRIFDTVYALASMYEGLSVPDWWEAEGLLIAENFGEALDDIVIKIGVARKLYTEWHTPEKVVSTLVIYSLLRVLSHLFILAKEKDIDLATAIELKHEFNKTRSYRHGGKRC